MLSGGRSLVSRYPSSHALVTRRAPGFERMTSVFHPGCPSNIPTDTSENSEVMSGQMKQLGGMRGLISESGISTRPLSVSRAIMPAGGGGISMPRMTAISSLSESKADNCRVSRDQLQKSPTVRATGSAKSSLARQLMLTDDLDFPGRIDEYSFSGGVAELMYGQMDNFDDIGHILAAKINSLIPALTLPVIEPKSKIRATVIGAGAYSLSISGSSGFMDQKISFPIRNVPVIRVDIDSSKLSPEYIISQINASFQRFDLDEGDDIVALYFKDPVRASYSQLELFAKSIESALPRSIRNKMPIILIFETDIACSVGSVMRRETDLKTNLLSLDELTLKEGDWIDIGEPLIAGQVFPVTVKSLVFYSN